MFFDKCKIGVITGGYPTIRFVILAYIFEQVYLEERLNGIFIELHE